MLYLHQFVGFQRGFNLCIVECDQVARKGLVDSQLTLRNVAAILFLEPEKKVKRAGKACGEQGSRAAAFASPRQRNALLEQIATQIGIDQSAFKIRDGLQQGGIAYTGFSSPSIKYPYLENPYG